MLRYGLVGLLRPLSVYPSEMVYWTVNLIFSTCGSQDLIVAIRQALPTVSIFQGRVHCTLSLTLLTLCQLCTSKPKLISNK